MLKIDRVISVSSEDPAWPAENLLKDEGKRNKWKCKSAGERSATVVLQLEKASKIKSIDVGNESSAFIEILVGKSCLTDDNYKVLLVASSLMTLKEAKDGTNTNGVRFFKDNHFCTTEVNEKWDRIKIVCSQPYNKHIQFGLAFIKFFGEFNVPSTAGSSSLQSSDSKVNTLGRFLIKEEKEDDIAIGSIFARRKELQDENKTSAASIRAATSQLLSPSNKPGKSPAQPKHSPHTKAGNPPAKQQNKRLSDATNGPENKKAKKMLPIKDDVPLNRNSTQLPKNTTQLAKNTPTKPQQGKKRNCKPFNEFMKGIVFAISGFQNPLRGDIRSKALEMGAKYKPDWDNTCSHLICAFSNTPKFNQVRGHGKIVKKDWIEQCYSKRIRLPWRRFALDPPDAKKPESEDEICEGNDCIDEEPSTSSSGPSNSIQQNPGPSLFGDMAKVKNKKPPAEKKVPSPKKNTPKKSPTKKRNSTESPEESLVSRKINSVQKNEEADLRTTVYLGLDLEKVQGDSVEGIADTESDQDWLEDEDSSLALPYLPEQFYDLSFYVADDFPLSEAADLKRYIVAHSGCVQESCSADTEYVIANTSSTISQLKEDFPQIIGVKAEWVWRCHDENRLLPTSNFEF